MTFTTVTLCHQENIAIPPATQKKPCHLLPSVTKDIAVLPLLPVKQ